MDLACLAGLQPAGVLAEVVNDDGTMARLPQLEVFARAHGLVLISIADLIAYRQRQPSRSFVLAPMTDGHHQIDRLFSRSILGSCPSARVIARRA